MRGRTLLDEQLEELAEAKNTEEGMALLKIRGESILLSKTTNRVLESAMARYPDLHEEFIERGKEWYRKNRGQKSLRQVLSEMASKFSE